MIEGIRHLLRKKRKDAENHPTVQYLREKHNMGILDIRTVDVITNLNNSDIVAVVELKASRAVMDGILHDTLRALPGGKRTHIQHGSAPPEIRYCRITVYKEG